MDSGLLEVKTNEPREPSVRIHHLGKISVGCYYEVGNLTKKGYRARKSVGASSGGNGVLASGSKTGMVAVPPATLHSSSQHP